MIVKLTMEVETDKPLEEMRISFIEGVSGNQETTVSKQSCVTVVPSVNGASVVQPSVQRAADVLPEVPAEMLATF